MRNQKLKTTKREAIENCLDGDSYYEKLREGWTTGDFDELLSENMISKCEACRSWEERESSGGNDEPIVCLECLENSLHKNAIEARRVLREVYHHEIGEPKKILLKEINRPGD